MPKGSNGVVELIALTGQDIKTRNQNISIGVNITKHFPTNVSGSPYLFSEDLAKRILVNWRARTWDEEIPNLEDV